MGIGLNAIAYTLLSAKVIQANNGCLDSELMLDQVIQRYVLNKVKQ
ncbi:hypothetical protein ACI8B_310019 [Acinetobacter proteolyticus]|uniref:Uncharacterized protein n=1 Tax=Acinetobacter proteolyticus TaxID=1776741 RepID=A0A653K8G2_9GAMM|nr:hypothetical protein ACI8B_310019 [Acinetobacter proteolyticus]